MKYCFLVYMDINIFFVAFRVEHFADGPAESQHCNATKEWRYIPQLTTRLLH